MKTIINVDSIICDVNNIHVDDFKDSTIELYHDLDDLKVYNQREQAIDFTLFSLRINTGSDKTIMIDINLDELEFLGNSIVNQISIVRRNYSEMIKKQIELDGNI